MIDPATISEAALRHGFKCRNKRNWIRGTDDFIQLVNVQGSAWSSDQSYLNFSLWPLALGEPRTIAESKFMFRTRAEDLGAADADALFEAADQLISLEGLRAAISSRSLFGVVSVELRLLLDQH